MKFSKSILGILFSSMVAISHAKLAMVIRHGEKINDSTTELSPRGKARAYCLVNAFGNNGTYVTPQKIYAQSPTEKKQSTRPRDTVTPLAEALGLTVDLSYTSGQIKKLTKNIMKTSEEVVLVSWSNDNIPEIAEKFGITNPPDWDGDAFDEVWMIYDSNTASYYKSTTSNGDGSNNLRKRETYTGDEGYSMDVVKEDIEDCINENVALFAQSTVSTQTSASSESNFGLTSSALNLSLFIFSMMFSVSLLFQ